jgi:hypothetical protein
MALYIEHREVPRPKEKVCTSSSSLGRAGPEGELSPLRSVKGQACLETRVSLNGARKSCRSVDGGSM